MAVPGGQQGLDPLGVGVAEAAQKDERLLPGDARALVIAGGYVGLADPDEDVRLQVGHAQVAQQDEGVAIAEEGVRMTAEAVVGVGDAVPGGGLTVAVAEFLEHGERLEAVLQGLSVLAEQGVVPADRVQDAGLRGAVAAGPEQVEGELVVTQGAGQVPALLALPAEAAVGVGTAGVVAQFGEEGQGLLQAGDGPTVQSETAFHPGESPQAPGLQHGVGEASGGVERGPLHGQSVVPVPAPVEERLQGPGQLAGETFLRGVPGRGGRFDDGEQHRVFGGEPGQGPVVVAERIRMRAFGCGRWGQRVGVGGEEPVGGVGGVQVVVEQPVERRPPVASGVLVVGEFTGVGAQQVVEAVAGGRGLGDEMQRGQFGQQRAGPAGRAGRPGWPRPGA